MQHRNLFRLMFAVAIISPVFLFGLPAQAADVIQSNICPGSPTITSPSTGTVTENTAINVVGTAEAGQEITMLDNGSGAGSVLVGADGTFGLSVSLSLGSNQLVANEDNPCTGLIEASTVTITRQAVPVPPVTPKKSTTKSTTRATTQTGASSTGSGTTTATPTTNNNGNNSSNNNLSFDVSNGTIVYTGEYWLSGTAPAGQLVTIFLNGKQVAQVYAASDGSYSVKINLAKGTNKIKAKLANGTEANLSIVLRPKTVKTTHYIWEMIGIIIGFLLFLALIVGIAIRLLFIKRRANGL